VRKTSEHTSPGNIERAAFHLTAFVACDEVFFPSLFTDCFYASSVTVETFKPEIAEAMKAYERHIVCLDKTPDEFQASLVSLLNKAIKAYESRGPQLRHGIALDRQVTVILSQNESPRPLCGIYFNLHSPYQKQSLQKAGKPIEETIGESSEE
jgi:hypothetical protein